MKRSVHIAPRRVGPYLGQQPRRSTEYSLVYLDRVAAGRVGWPVSPLVDGIPDIENVTNAIQNGPYGKCVYECDNDVCDHQVLPKSLLTMCLYQPTNYALMPRSSISSMRQAQLYLLRWSPTPNCFVSDRAVYISPTARSSAT